MPIRDLYLYLKNNYVKCYTRLTAALALNGKEMS